GGRVEQGVAGTEGEQGVEDGGVCGGGGGEGDQRVADQDAEPADLDGNGFRGQLPGGERRGGACGGPAPGGPRAGAGRPPPSFKGGGQKPRGYGGVATVYGHSNDRRGWREKPIDFKPPSR